MRSGQAYWQHWRRYRSLLRPTCPFADPLLALKKAHFTDYSIHHDPIHSLLIANFKWTGEDWDADMAEVGEDEETRRWWKMVRFELEWARHW